MKIAITERAKKDIEKTLKKMANRERSLARKILSQALRKGGKLTLADAKSNAPVGKTGMFKKGLKLRVAKSRNRQTVRFRVINDPDQWYGKFVELGTLHIKAQHAFRRAADATRSTVTQLVISELRANL